MGKLRFKKKRIIHENRIVASYRRPLKEIFYVRANAAAYPESYRKQLDIIPNFLSNFKPKKYTGRKFIPDGKLKKWGKGRYPIYDTSEWVIIQKRGKPFKKKEYTKEEQLYRWKVQCTIQKKRTKHKKEIKAKILRKARRDGRRPRK